MKKTLVVLVLLFSLMPAVKAEIPSIIPHYPWGTKFEVINKEHDLVPLDNSIIISDFLINKGNLTAYFVKSALIYSSDGPLLIFIHIFDDNKLVSVYLFVHDLTIYKELENRALLGYGGSLDVPQIHEELHCYLGGHNTIATFSIASAAAAYRKPTYATIIFTYLESSPHKEQALLHAATYKMIGTDRLGPYSIFPDLIRP